MFRFNSGHRPALSPPLLLLLSLILLFARRGEPDLAADRVALVAFRAAVGLYLPWNLTASSPCSWPGVTCESGRVTVLRLPGTGLIGQIPSPVLGNLTALHTLSLRFNALSGPLPSDLASLTQLRYLYLHGNKFIGQIPTFLFSLQNLIRLNLADNNFTGEIPATVNNLTRLGTLYLERNNLVGQIPDLDLPNLNQFNVSFNRLNGSIPQKLRTMQADSFLNTSLCGGPLPACPWEVSPPSLKKSSKLSGGAIAGIAVGAAIGVLIILALLILLCRKKSSKGSARSADVAVAAVDRPPEAEVPLTDKRVVGETIPTPPAAVAPANVAAENGTKRLTFFWKGPKVYDLEDLLRASAEVLGKGTFGTAYKAVLEMGTVVAVKRLKEVSITEREFRERITAIGALEHPNLVALRAYYYSKDERLLVYDYMLMGSLSSLLHGELLVAFYSRFINCLFVVV